MNLWDDILVKIRDIPSTGIDPIWMPISSIAWFTYTKITSKYTDLRINHENHLSVIKQAVLQKMRSH